MPLAMSSKLIRRVGDTFFPKLTIFNQKKSESRVCAVAQYAVFEANAKVNGRGPFSHPNPSETSYQISMSCQIYYYHQRVDVQNWLESIRFDVPTVGLALGGRTKRSADTLSSPLVDSVGDLTCPGEPTHFGG